MVWNSKILLLRIDHVHRSNLHWLINHLILPRDIVPDQNRSFHNSWLDNSLEVHHWVLLIIDSINDWSVLLCIVHLRIEEGGRSVIDSSSIFESKLSLLILRNRVENTLLLVLFFCLHDLLLLSFIASTFI